MASAREVLGRLNLRNPFRPLVWPGVGPNIHWDRDWPELVGIAVAVLLFWRGVLVSGVPLTIDAALRSLLHPIFGVPVMMGGLASGVRFELLLGLLAAASGMWWLGVALGLGRLSRIWASLAFAYAGGVASGLAVGRFGLDLGSVWLPWTIACAILAVHLRRALYAAAAAVALALTLLGGDLGLTIATGFVLLLFVGVAGASLRGEKPYVTFRPREATIAGLIALLGFGLAAVQLVPLIAAAFRGMPQTLAQPDQGLALFLGALVARTEGTIPAGPYTYLGLAPIIFLAGLPLAVGQENRRTMLGFGFLAVLALAWVSSGRLHPIGAALGLWAWGATAVLALAALGLDALWQWSIEHLRLRRMHVLAVARWGVAWLIVVASALLIVTSLLDLYMAYVPSGSRGDVPILTRLSLGDSIYSYLTQRPVAFWIGAGLSALSLLGLLAVVMDDLRSRRTLLVIPAIYTAGVLQPATPLDLPDGMLVRVAFDVADGEAALSSNETPLADDGSGVAEAPGAAAFAVEKSAATTPASSVTGQLATSAAHAVPQATLTQREALQLGMQASPSAYPWKLPAWQAGFLLLFVLMVGIVLFLRLFKLGTLQSEIYGDIIMVRNYVAGVLSGRWPTRFDLSAGPLYHYLIAPIAVVTGLDYVGLKIASVIVSLGALAATYAFSRRLINDYFALLTTFIAGVSSWLLIFSRLGNSQILLPLLTAASLWLVVRVAQSDRQSDLVACAIVSALGPYVYPQSIVLPAVIFLTLLCLRWVGFPISRRKLGSFVLVAVLCAIPFVFIALSDVANFTGGYIGSKISTESDPLPLLVRNIAKALLAFNVRGDEIFRSNPSGLPHLDWISGVLFLGGILFWFTSKERRRWVPLWLVPLLLLQVPSILALNQPHEVPSASRTLGVAPIVYMLVASGVWWLIQAMRACRWRWLHVGAVTGVLLGGILLLNVQRYFKGYISGLPYEDTPIGRLIANYADALPADTQVYMVGCCWEHSIPDRFVDREVARPQNWHYVEAKDLSCLQLQFLQSPAAFVWSFRDALPAPQLEACRQWLPAQLYTYHDRPVFYAAPLRPDLPPVSADARQLAQPGMGVDVTPVEVDGQTIDFLYSKLDMGVPANMFDGDVSTLARGLEANPFVLEFYFPEPRSIGGLSADFAHMDFVVTAKLFADERAEPKSYTQEFRGQPADPHIDMAFDGAPSAVQILRLEVLQLDPPSDVHIHVREVKLR